MKKIKLPFTLTRPLIIFDFETTGVDTSKDRIVELAMLKIHPGGSTESKELKLNPTIPIPKGASDVHGILDEHVKGCPTFKQIAKGLLAFIFGSDLGTFNGNKFDIPLLHSELDRAGIEWDFKVHRFIDASVIFRRFEKRSLEAALMFYCNKELEGAHGAMADTVATLDVLIAQAKRYKDEFPKDFDELHLFCNYDKEIIDLRGCFEMDDDGDLVLTFGKHKGVASKEVPNSYWNWMLTSDFGNDTKLIVKQIISSKK